jgi:WD40 repeat protein
VTWHPEEDLLASSSYDDTVRLYREDADDWVQVASIDGHGETVWWVEFEGAGMPQKDFRSIKEGLTDEQKAYLDIVEKSGPRLATCSDDCTVRIWRRIPKERSEQASSNTGIPSIIRSFSVDEEWHQEAILPRAHDRAIYSISWSKKTGMIVSAGSDGKVIVYKERWKTQQVNGIKEDETIENGKENEAQIKECPTEWVVVAELFSAHDVFEINHITWANRSDTGKKSEDEEVIISTGDDGEVKVWMLNDGITEEASA